MFSFWLKYTVSPARDKPGGCPWLAARWRNFPGRIGYRMWGPPADLGTFKFDTAKKAKEMGATHIYWGEDVDGLAG